jgi:hypothetical protein
MNNSKSVSTTTIFLSTSLSSIIASFVTYPIELIKINYQNSNKTTSQVAKQIYNSGAKNFFRGSLPNLFCYPLFWTLFFTANDKLKNYNKIVSVLIPGTFAVVLVNPIFVIKNRMQTKYLLEINNKINYPRIINEIFEDEKLKGFTKGITPTLIGNIKLLANFWLYDIIYHYLGNIDQNKKTLIASTSSKILFNNITYPLDLIRTKQRSDTVKYNSVYNIFIDIIKTNKISGIYRGCLLYNLVTVPNFVIIMVLKNYFINTFS